MQQEYEVEEKKVEDRSSVRQTLICVSKKRNGEIYIESTVWYTQQHLHLVVRQTIPFVVHKSLYIKEGTKYIAILEEKPHKKPTSTKRCKYVKRKKGKHYREDLLFGQNWYFCYSASGIIHILVTKREIVIDTCRLFF